MHDGLKICVGLGVTALLAAVLHGPIGRGAAFVAQQQANLASDAARPSGSEAVANASPTQLASVEPAPKPSQEPPPIAALAPSPPPAPARLDPCQKTVDAALHDRVMTFRSGSAWLNPQSRAMIADVAGALKRCRGYALEVAGHSDANGSAAINRAMSQERADRVRAALVEQGIPATALTAKGYGAAHPLQTGHAGDLANRRISFTVTKGGA